MKGKQGGTGANQFKQSGQNVQSATSETLAALHGVCEKAIRRDGKRAEALDKRAETAPEQAQACAMARSGSWKCNRIGLALGYVGLGGL